MPSEDVSDLRDVVYAINKLCDTMKTSYEDCDVRQVDEELIEPTEVVIQKVETHVAENWTEPIESAEAINEKMIRTAVGLDVVEDVQMSPSENVEIEAIQCDTTDENDQFTSEHMEEIKMIRSDQVKEVETIRSDQVKEVETIRSDQVKEVESIRSDQFKEVKTIPSDHVKEVVTISDHVKEVEPIRPDQVKEVKTIRSDTIDETETVVSDSDLATAEPMQCDPTSEMYFTASSEASLLSDVDIQERLCLSDDSDKRRDDRNSVMAGHVAAMREHFESMTRTNTPCPDLMRSSSPSFEVFRTVTNSPDN